MSSGCAFFTLSAFLSYPFLLESMASSSTACQTWLSFVPMALKSLFIFPVDAIGFAFVFSLHLSIRFSLQDSTIWVERKIYDTAISLLSLTMRENPRFADNGSPLWELGAGKYRVYGFFNSSTNVSTDIHTPPHSSASILNIPPVVKVKLEPSIHTVINLSDSSDGDEPPLSTSIPKPSPSSLRSTFDTPPHLSPLSPSSTRPHMSILQCLHTLASMPGRKNILKKIDYDTLQIMDANFLLPRFDGNQILCPPPRWCLLFSYEGQIYRWHGQTLRRPCLDQNPNHQHYEWLGPCFSFSLMR